MNHSIELYGRFCSIVIILRGNRGKRRHNLWDTIPWVNSKRWATWRNKTLRNKALSKARDWHLSGYTTITKFLMEKDTKEDDRQLHLLTNTWDFEMIWRKMEECFLSTWAYMHILCDFHTIKGGKGLHGECVSESKVIQATVISSHIFQHVEIMQIAITFSLINSISYFTYMI